VSEVAVACCQLAPRIGELERNRAETRTAIVEAAGEGARIVVLPELAGSGYVFADAQEARACAEPLDGPTVGSWTALAREHDLVIVGGVCEDDDVFADRRPELYA
jgi:predicted amidohydrolase